MITVPAHVKNSKIEQDIRRKPGNPIVILRYERYPYFAKIGRVIFSRTFITCFVITTFVLYTSRAPFLKAEATSFYPKACLGGFDAVKNAEGKPETKVDSDSSDFDIENSAYLNKDTSAEMYCGNFDGEVPDHTSPTDLKLTIFLAAKTNVPTIISNDPNSSSTTFLKVLDATGATVLENKEAVGGEGGTASGTLPQGVGVDPIGTPSGAPVHTDTQVTPEVPPVKEETKSVEPVVSPAPTDAPQAVLQKASLFASIFATTVFAEESDGNTVSAPLEASLGVAKSSAPVVADQTAPSPQGGAGDLPSSGASDTGTTKTGDGTSPTQNKESVTGASTTVTEAVSSSTTEVASSTESGEKKESILSEVKNIFGDEEISQNTATSTMHPLYEVSYNVGGGGWVPIAQLGNENTKTLSLTIPPASLTSWSDVSKLQVKIKSLDSLDPHDDLFVDGMSLVIHYSKEKTTEREYSLQNIENTGDEITVATTGERGKATTLSVKSKEKKGVAIYDIGTGGLLLSTETNPDNNESVFDPNAIFPDYGSFAFVLTEDPNWCSDKKLGECIATSTFKGVSFIDLFLSKTSKESEHMKAVKKDLVGKSYSFLKEKAKLEEEQKVKENASSTEETGEVVLDKGAETAKKSEKKEAIPQVEIAPVSPAEEKIKSISEESPL